jgi:lysozyme family protein
MNFTSKLKNEYTNLLDTMEVRPEWKDAIDRRARTILSNKERYQAVSDQLGGLIPWGFIGVIHSLEASLTFDTALHNGDKIIGTNKKTYRVPKGRGPFSTWEEAAVDALKIKKLDQVTDWSDERVCYELERYNGFGYRNYHPSVLSPYLWSGSNHYTRGKYVSDGKWSSTARSAQSGAVLLFKRLAEIDVTKKEVIRQSTKLSLIKRVKNFFAGFSFSAIMAEYLGYLEQAKDFLVENKSAFIWGMIGVASVSWFIFKALENKGVNEYKEGRYIPSGQKDGEDV